MADLVGFVLFDPDSGVIAQGVHATRALAEAELAWKLRTSRHRFAIYELRRAAA